MTIILIILGILACVLAFMDACIIINSWRISREEELEGVYDKNKKGIV